MTILVDCIIKIDLKVNDIKSILKSYGGIISSKKDLNLEMAEISKMIHETNAINMKKLFSIYNLIVANGGVIKMETLKETYLYDKFNNKIPPHILAKIPSDKMSVIGKHPGVKSIKKYKP
jgi:hypothetical protein